MLSQEEWMEKGLAEASGRGEAVAQWKMLALRNSLLQEYMEKDYLRTTAFSMLTASTGTSS